MGPGFRRDDTENYLTTPNYLTTSRNYFTTPISR
jgi:hypothetical protein